MIDQLRRRRRKRRKRKKKKKIKRRRMVRRRRTRKMDLVLDLDQQTLNNNKMNSNLNKLRNTMDSNYWPTLKLNQMTRRLFRPVKLF